MNRRRFLRGGASAGLVFVTPLSSMLLEWSSRLYEVAERFLGARFDKEALAVLLVTQEHLLPTTALAPDAKSPHALDFLMALIKRNDVDRTGQALIQRGIRDVEALARQEFNRAYLSLSPLQREQMLRRYETSDTGQQWLSLMLMVVLEAMLSDPVYGGNPGGASWKWLGIRPGFPRPPIGKRYYEL